MIDMSSDTKSHPTLEMRRAMAEAEVGDDVYGEDPTVNRLEATAATRLGKEAAVFVSSGTLANLVSVLAHSPRESAVLVGDDSHVFHREREVIEALGGVRVRGVATDSRGVMRPDDLEEAFGSAEVERQRVSLVCLENTHNRKGGQVLDSEDIGAAAQVARRHGAGVFVDGARLFNAAVALGVPVRELSLAADTVSFCLSKGLGCPAGSLVCGSAETVAIAREVKKKLGGGMRQVGSLAAAGLVALDSMVDRLSQDHANARHLAQGLASLPGLRLDPDTVETNVVLFQVVDHPVEAFIDALRRRGLLINQQDGPQVRMLTHPGISSGDADEALNIVHQATTELQRRH
jgi:threonine aldolase